MSRLINQYTISRADSAIDTMENTLEQMRRELKAIPFNSETAQDIKRATAQIDSLETCKNAIYEAIAHCIAVANAAPDKQTVAELKTMCSQYRAMLTRRGIDPNNSHFEHANFGEFKARSHV
jgi:hypothetical protein